ncbi:DUF262 domain-containing protein [Pseudomonas mangrovi]|uniref:GmrSD restriction endonucleases N-terminal domain-containing protein n=1 Tax=Pseudomonas mangrovi TaxID=2161748 RepID=A0A2T5P4Y4_9PSED|nr:DUF262 domain-containing protein [Pseudomonas mangrovi]PTU72806.1 hypothetical protein DBO85_18835 [Pseudomonas mangrovi]
MQMKDPKPEIMRLEELAILVKSGEIKLPKFQRPFVWQKSDMLKLLDSIYKGYPIGSILIWNSSQKLTSERSISGLEVNTDESTRYPTNYLLDGQQRLTTLCGALFWDGVGEKDIWNIHFDLESETFVHPPENNLVSLFPLNRLIKTSDFIRQCMKFEHLEDGRRYFETAERLLRSIKDYKIAVVKIGDMTIDEVAPIFERINSTGRKLTIVDLMMAATWSDDFDLSREIGGIREACSELGFNDVSDQIILRSIAAAAGFGINKEDIQRLRSKSSGELKSAALEARESLAVSLLFLSEHLNIKDFSYIPYGMQLTHLVEFHRICRKPTPGQVSELTRWFWGTSATRYFGGASTGQNNKDLKSIRDFARGDSAALFPDDAIDISRLMYDDFNLKNASSTTFTLLLNLQCPSETIDGRSIDGGHLKEKSSKFFSSASPVKGEIEKINLSKVIYPYSDSLNPGSAVIDDEALSKHLLSKDVYAYWEAGDDVGFASARAKIVAELVQNLTGCKVKYMPPEKHLSNGEEEYEEQN